MKINFEYEEKDITGGHYFIRNTSPVGSDNIGFARTVTLKVGWFSGKDDGNKYCLISVFTDGWVHCIGNKESIAEYLTKNNYRPLSRAEALKQIQDHGVEYFRDRFNI